MRPDLPEAPPAGRRGLPTVPPAGPYWRLWHPSRHTVAADAPRRYGPLHRFDPHPAGAPSVHDAVFVLDGSLAFEVSALEVFHRRRASLPIAIEICPSWRGTLIGAPARSRLFDLTDEATAESVGGSVRLGDTDFDEQGYEVTQGWGRFLHDSRGLHGVRYLSCRAADRGGIAVALWRHAAIGAPRAQHLLIDDALWPYLVYTLDSVGVGVTQVARCGRC